MTDLAWHPQQPLLASSLYGKVDLWDWRLADAPDEQICTFLSTAERALVTEWPLFDLRLSGQQPALLDMAGLARISR